MKNLSIAARITIGFGLLLVALAIIGSITLQGLGRIDRRVDEVASHELMFFAMSPSCACTWAICAALRKTIS
jgi:methyl-accepting chemotaxis protein